MSADHDTLVIVSCTDPVAHHIMDLAQANGGTISYYTGNALDELRRGDPAFMRAALFGVEPAQVQPGLAAGTTQADLAQTGGAGGEVG